MSKRISVNEQLPENTWENKIVWDSENGFDIASCGKNGTWTNIYGDRLYKVKYWWELPEEPKEVEV